MQGPIFHIHVFRVGPFHWRTYSGKTLLVIRWEDWWKLWPQKYMEVHHDA